MKNKIIISKPYIKEGVSEIFGSSVKLCAEVTMVNPNTNKKELKECYFEFETSYKEYICNERSDAFIMGLLTTAMENNMDIEFEAPISEQLYYQMMTYYIPMVSKYNSTYPMHNISLIGPYESKVIENEKAVATGCSGGVDSFYTIVKHGKNSATNEHKLTHLIFNSCGTGDDVKERIISVYKDNMKYLLDLANECDLKLIYCFNNLYEFYKKPLDSFVTFFTTVYGAAAYALQKLISVYYASSGYPITDFYFDLSKVHGYDPSSFDVFTLSCMNTENIKFYSSGMECSRIEKESYISNDKSVMKYLKVCNLDEYKTEKMEYLNCSECPKCLRTMAQFYALGKLDNFKEIFNVEHFLKNKSRSFGKMMALNKKLFVDEMKIEAKKNNIKIPFFAYIYVYFWYKPIEFLRKVFRNSLFARKIYYKLNLDYKLDGYRGSNYEKYRDKL